MIVFSLSITFLHRKFILHSYCRELASDEAFESCLRAVQIMPVISVSLPNGCWKEPSIIVWYLYGPIVGNRGFLYVAMHFLGCYYQGSIGVSFLIVPELGNSFIRICVIAISDSLHLLKYCSLLDLNFIAFFKKVVELLCS